MELHNFQTIQEIHQFIKSKFNYIGFTNGHIYSKNIFHNPYWTIKEDNNIYLLMFCEPNAICKLCWKSYQTIFEFELKHNLQLIWTKHTDGKIVGNNTFYMHNVIKGAYNDSLDLNENINIKWKDFNYLNNSYNNLIIHV